MKRLYHFVRHLFKRYRKSAYYQHRWFSNMAIERAQDVGLVDERLLEDPLVLVRAFGWLQAVLEVFLTVVSYPTRFFSSAIFGRSDPFDRSLA